MNQDDIDLRKQENINFMNDFYQNTAQVKYSDFHGENTLSSGVEIMLEDEKYLIPEHCRFINKNIEYISNYLPFDENTFDFIMMDPPWTNRYIKRIKKSSNQQR